MRLDQKTIRKIGAALALPRKALRKRAVAPSAAEPGAAKEVTPAICEKIRSGSDPSSAEHDSLPARLKLSPQSRKVFLLGIRLDIQSRWKIALVAGCREI